MPKGTNGFFAGSRLQQGPPPRTLPRCGACGLHKVCNSPKMPLAGTGRRGVLFVGEAPGANEDEEGRPFVGRAGERLRSVLDSLDFDFDRDGWATNALICRPPKNRKPKPAEIDYCRPNLWRVVKTLRPTVVVLLGGAAVQAAIGPIWQADTGAVSRWVGWGIPDQALNAWVHPTWHPSFILREDDPVLDRQLKTHLQAALDHCGKPWPGGPPNWSRGVQRVFDPDKAAMWLRETAARSSGAVAWDYEANMLKPDGPDARIVSCAVAWGREEPEECIAYPWHGAAIPATQTLLRSRTPKIACNLKFEDRWTRKVFGHRVRAWAWDTMLAAHVCDNRSAITSLKFQAFVRLGVPAWNRKIEPFLKSKGDEVVNRILREIEIDDLLLYNGLDALLAFRVAVDQIRELGYPMPWSI